MALKNVFLVLVVSSAFFYGAFGQSDDDCVPNSVQQLMISSNATLYWHMDPYEPCEITLFEIDIVGDRNDQYHFKVSHNYVDVSFLEVCEKWSFTVTPISNGVIGFARTLTEHIPLPDDADLSLSYFNATALGGRDVLLEWDLNTHVYGDCTLEYRLSVADEELGISQDVYIQGSALHLSFLSPCVPYQLALRAINRAQPNIEGPQIGMYFEIPAKPQIIPTLSSIEIGATTISMSWALEGNSNRCPLKDLHLDGGNNFNITVPLINSLDPEPVEVELKALQSDRMYYFRVYVENSGGSSPAFPLAVQTLELTPS